MLQLRRIQTLKAAQQGDIFMQEPKQIKRIGILTRPNTPNIQEIFFSIQEGFLACGIEVFPDKESADVLGTDGFDLEWLAHNTDAIASLGGDGTLLSLCRKLYGKDIPIFGINIGNLGFLTAISPSQTKDFAKELHAADYTIQSHMMLEATVNSKHYFAINEFLICQNTHGILEISAYINHENLNTYRGDSLIIATPTGSTAYNISAGGSIVYPLCQNILLTPVAAHTLTQRPMVLDSSFVLSFCVNSPATLLVDGQERIPLTPESTLTIQKASKNVALIQPKNRCYFEVLREKFQWGQSQLNHSQNLENL